MDPKALVKNKEYVLQHIDETQKQVFFVHETINYYVFVSNCEMIRLTPWDVKNRIDNAKKME